MNGDPALPSKVGYLMEQRSEAVKMLCPLCLVDVPECRVPNHTMYSNNEDAGITECAETDII